MGALKLDLPQVDSKRAQRRKEHLRRKRQSCEMNDVRETGFEKVYPKICTAKKVEHHHHVAYGIII